MINISIQLFLFVVELKSKIIFPNNCISFKKFDYRIRVLKKFECKFVAKYELRRTFNLLMSFSLPIIKNKKVVCCLIFLFFKAQHKTKRTHNFYILAVLIHVQNHLHCRNLLNLGLSCNKRTAYKTFICSFILDTIIVSISYDF